MNNSFVGKICPYCKTEIKENDEVVICSQCDMPHHKDCWIDNQGCTTFGCTGTISSPEQKHTEHSEDDFEIELFDDDPSGTEQFQYCVKCGTRNRIENAFCFRCGNALTNTNNSVSSKDSQYSISNAVQNSVLNPQDSDLHLLIGTNTDYYLKRIDTINSKKANWNWAAFLLAPFWMIYRKMYIYGAAVLGGMLLLSFIRNWVGYILLLGIYIVLGLFGNFIYLFYITKKAAQAKSQPAQTKSLFIAKYGGTNMTAAILSGVGYTIFALIIQLAW